MQFLATPRDRAGLLILVLGVAILLALTPFLSGLLGAAILYVIFVGLYKRLARVMPREYSCGVVFPRPVRLAS